MIKLHIVGTQADVDAIYKYIKYFDHTSLFSISHSESPMHHPWLDVKIKPGHDTYDHGFTPYKLFTKFINGYILSKQLYDTGTTFYYNYSKHKQVYGHLYSWLRNQLGLTVPETILLLNIGESIDTLRERCVFDDYYATLASARAKALGLKRSLLIL